MEYLAALNKLKEWTDSQGWLGQKHKIWGLEFGDGVQRTGTLYISKYYMEPAEEQRRVNAEAFAEILHSCLKFSISRKTRKTDRPQWTRHWDSSRWPGELWTGSRDNFDPFLMSACLYAPYNEYVERIRKLMIKEVWRRKCFLWNYKHIWPIPEYQPKMPDIIWPWNLIARQIRGSRSWYLYPLLLICDFDSVFNSIFSVILSIREPDSTSDDLNHINRLAFKQMIYWTPTVWLAKMIYRLRLQPGKDKNSRADNGMSAAKNALRYYARRPEDTPMYLVLDFIVDEYL